MNEKYHSQKLKYHLNEMVIYENKIYKIVKIDEKEVNLRGGDGFLTFNVPLMFLYKLEKYHIQVKIYFHNYKFLSELLNKELDILNGYLIYSVSDCEWLVTDFSLDRIEINTQQFKKLLLNN
jgi:hypothetical protein